MAETNRSESCRSIVSPLWRMVVGLAWLLTSGSVAWSHGSAMDILVNSQGKLQPYLFPSGIPIPGPAEFIYSSLSDRIVSSDPGIGVVNEANGLAVNTLLRLNVVSPLIAWNGAHFVAPRETVTVASPDGIGTYAVTRDSGYQTGMKWGIYPGGLFWDEHGFFFLDPTTATTGIFGVWIEIASPNYITSDPFLVPFIYDPQVSLTRQQIDEAVDRLVVQGNHRPGDFDHNQQLDVADLDTLTSIVNQQTHPAAYDVTFDGLVNADDRQVWIDDLFGTFLGDSNLDGEFNSSDLILALQSGEYEDDLVRNSTWATGDWDGDLEFTTGDLVVAFQAAGYEQGPRPAVAAPEPSGWLLCGGAAAGWISRLRRRRR